MNTITTSDTCGPGDLGRVSLFFIAASVVLMGQTTQTITITSITNSADFQPGLPQPGSLATISTTGLVGGSGTIWMTDFPLTNQLNAISVWIASIPAPILSITFLDDYQQITVEVPWEASGTNLDVEVAQNGISSHAEVQAVGSILFYVSVFFVDSNGYGIIQHAADYSLVTPESPARPGEYLIAYGINLGPVSNHPADGNPAPFDPLGVSIPVPPVCTMNDTIRWGSTDRPPLAQTPVLFVGLAPGTIGVYQINFQVPESIPASDVIISFQRNLAENVISCPGTGLGTQLFTQLSRPVLLTVGEL